MKSDGSCSCNNMCGVNGVCTAMRKGTDCDQPNCKNLMDCHGQGVCVAISMCKSKCECHLGFKGPTCSEKIVRKVWGDPHLETLDGKKFNYFGIGQYWGCISDTIAYQFRFFGINGTSFIGAMSVKLGLSSIITISCISETDSQLPKIRINGNLLDNLNDTYSKSFDNNTIKLNVNNFQYKKIADSTVLVLLTIDYANGAFLFMSVSYSPIMRRQFMSFGITPSPSMINKTFGLCGNSNNNPNDDFMGPNGELFESVSDFGDSWKIYNTFRIDGGLENSWSDSKSNFHVNDTMDKSYINFNYKPIYSIDHFPESEKRAATSECLKEKLEKEMLQNCIFDILFTKDVFLGHQYLLSLNKCPNDCSYRGICSDGRCRCLEGWSGESCEISECERCIHGNCVQGFCVCLDGFEGPHCNVEAKCDPPCSRWGTCIKSSKCKCKQGWTSSTCSEEAKCSTQCLKNGVCIDHNTCLCNKGYNGTHCSDFTCEGQNWCSENGLCIEYENCLCSKGWKGLSCSVPVCDNDCSGNGYCSYPGKCNCYKGFKGSDCSEKSSCLSLNNCNGKGICDNEFQKCICDFGYTGKDCSQPICDERCNLHGVCVEPFKCECDKGFTGFNCQEYSCVSMNYCSGHGACKNMNKCVCDANWSGEKCDQVSCSSLEDCSDNGICLDGNTCFCERGFQGKTCSALIKEDQIEKPKFSKGNYSITVNDNIKIGAYIHKFESETNEDKMEIYFALLNQNLPFNINSRSGILTAAKKLNESNYNMNVMVTNRYKSSIAHLSIKVVAVVECPKTTIPKTNSVFRIFSNSSKGLIVTPISINNNNDASSIKLTGFNDEPVGFGIKVQLMNIITTERPLKIGKYNLKLTVNHPLEESCSSIVTFTIEIIPESLNRIYTQQPTTAGTTIKTEKLTINDDSVTLTPIPVEKLMSTEFHKATAVKTELISNNFPVQTTDFENSTRLYNRNTGNDDAKTVLTYSLIAIGCIIALIGILTAIIYVFKIRKS